VALWFALMLPLVLWLLLTVVVAATAPSWINVPGCCAIDGSFLLAWLVMLGRLFVVLLIPSLGLYGVITLFRARLRRFRWAALLTSLATGAGLALSFLVLATRIQWVDRVALTGAIFVVAFTSILLTACIGWCLAQAATHRPAGPPAP
jgi:hypothetical protein